MAPDAPITLGEGWTPLLRAEALQRELDHAELWIKDERQQPTGSFKDRQAALTISALKAKGIDEVVLASTGNAAAAYAAFCARAGIKLWLFLTSTVPAEKTRELALYGVEVVKVTGTYDQAKRVAASFAARRDIYIDSGAKAIPGKESMKTLAFEIAEQMNWQPPDWYVQAVSGGIGPLGVLKGFHELYDAGLIDRIPKVASIQVAGCAPMVQAWEAKERTATPVQPDTLITVLATGDPGHAYTMLYDAAQQNGGAFTAVDDGEAFRAMRRVARLEGMSMEPAASVAFAGVDRLVREGIIGRDERVVINCSGHTFSAEKHTLEERYILHLETESIPAPGTSALARHVEGLQEAFNQLDEQITSIVIVDDNPHDSRLIRRLLQAQKNYRVFEAHNGPDGIDLIRQRQPDLVVLDLTMPEMDGFSVLATLKAEERTRSIPVVIISAKHLSADERHLLNQYTESVWQKGNFSVPDLMRHVQGLLSHGDAPPSAPPPVATSSVPLTWTPTNSDASRLSILVVDDNTLDARLMRRLFEAKQRFRVWEAYNLHQARSLLTEESPDLLIVESELPDGSVDQWIRDLRDNEATRYLPILLVSRNVVSPALSRLVDSVWEKGSMDRSNLLAHVESLLSQ